MKCSEVIGKIRNLCPEEYAEKWDNTGLLAGDDGREAGKILIALDATDSAIEYAVNIGADMLVTHHPLIFSPLKRITAGDFTGRRIIKLIENGITCYAMHTNFDVCCMAGAAADIIGMDVGLPLEETAVTDGNPRGIGRYAVMPERSVYEWAETVKSGFGLEHVTVYGKTERIVSRVAVSPGSGRSMIGAAAEKDVQLLITGDIGHHEGIDAVMQGVSVIDAGHYGLEHIFIDYMAGFLRNACEGTGIYTFYEGCPGKII